MRTASCPLTNQPSSAIQLEACMVLATEGLPIAPCGVIGWEMNTTLGTCHQGGWWWHLWGVGGGVEDLFFRSARRNRRKTTPTNTTIVTMRPNIRM